MTDPETLSTENLLDRIADHTGAKAIEHPDLAGPVLALPPDWRHHDLESLAIAPNRVRQTLTMQRLGDFLAYLKRYLQTHSLVVFAPELTLGKPLARCIVDYHVPMAETAAARWGSHRAVFQPVPSLAYALLLEFDGKLFDQSEFARRLRDVARFCSSHAAADLLELVRTLNLTSKGAFQTYDDDLSGSVSMRFELEVSATAGTQQKKLDVPRELTFTLPLLDQGEPQQIRAELAYRVPNGSGQKVQLGLRLPDRMWIERDLIDALAAKIVADTGLLTIVGEAA